MKPSGGVPGSIEEMLAGWPSGVINANQSGPRWHECLSMITRTARYDAPRRQANAAYQYF